VAFNPSTGVQGGIPRAPCTFGLVVCVPDSSTGAGPFGSGQYFTLAVGQGSPACLVSLAQLGGAAFIGQLPAFQMWVLDQFGNPLSGVVLSLALVPILTVGPVGFGAGSVVQATAVNSVGGDVRLRRDPHARPVLSTLMSN
jgi:hypothetical protein